MNDSVTGMTTANQISSMPSVYVVILHYSNADYTAGCLESLVSSNYSNAKILLLDSSDRGNLMDDSRIRSAVETLNVRYTKVPNLGYAGCNNLGIDEALIHGADYIFLINNDTRIDTDTISLLVEQMQADRKALVAGPTIYNLIDGVPSSEIQSAGQYLTFLGKAKGARGMAQITYVSGCAIMISRKCAELVGKLNDRFFMYYEETDYCYRARKIGKVVVVPTARVWHKQESFQSQNSVSIYYNVRNRLWFLYLHRKVAFLFAAFILCLLAFWKAIRCYAQGNRELSRAYLTGALHGMGRLRRLENEQSLSWGG